IDAICPGRLCRHRTGAACYIDDHGYTRSDDDRSDYERNVCDAGAAGGSGGGADGFTRPELSLDARVLALEWHDLCLGTRELDRPPETDCGLRGRPLASPRQPVDVDRRSVAVIAWQSAVNPKRCVACSVRRGQARGEQEIDLAFRQRRAKRLPEPRRRIGCEAVAHDVFGHDARHHELEKIIAVPGFRAAA